MRSPSPTGGREPATQPPTHAAASNYASSHRPLLPHLHHARRCGREAAAARAAPPPAQQQSRARRGWFSDACASYTARMRLNPQLALRLFDHLPARAPTRPRGVRPRAAAARAGGTAAPPRSSTRTPLSEGPRPTVASATGSSTRTPSAGRCSTRARCSTAGTRVTRWHGTPCCAGTRLLGT